MSRVFIDCGGPTHRIPVGKKTFCFEMHPYLGPMLVKADGSGLKREPVHVLRAIEMWVKQGQRKDHNGDCVWSEPLIFG